MTYFSLGGNGPGVDPTIALSCRAQKSQVHTHIRCLEGVSGPPDFVCSVLRCTLAFPPKLK